MYVPLFQIKYAVVSLKVKTRPGEIIITNHRTLSCMEKNFNVMNQKCGKPL